MLAFDAEICRLNQSHGGENGEATDSNAASCDTEVKGRSWVKGMLRS